MSAALVWPGMFMAGIVSIVVIISLNVRNALPIVCSLSPRAAPVMVTHWPVTAHTHQVRWEDNQGPLQIVSRGFLISIVITTGLFFSFVIGAGAIVSIFKDF